MASYPTGTVTFLFTDIEGSTKLLQHLGDAAYFPMLRTEGSSSDFSERINKHVESIVEAQLNSVFPGGKPRTAKLAGLTAFGLITLLVFLGLLVGLAFLIKAVFF